MESGLSLWDKIAYIYYAYIYQVRIFLSDRCQKAVRHLSDSNVDNVTNKLIVSIL